MPTFQGLRFCKILVQHLTRVVSHLQTTRRVPENSPWLDAYLLELTTFPNSKYDDQVDSTVNALAWLTQQTTVPGWGWLELARRELSKQEGRVKRSARMTRVRMPHAADILPEYYAQSARFPL